MPKTLLAVDDSATMRKVLEITFSGEDYRVVTADSAQAALGKMSEEPKVVVIDTVLGGDDGYALSKEVRRRDGGAVIVLLSSRHNPYDQARGAEAGADDYMDKPFDTQQMADKVRKAVAAREGGAAPAFAATKTAGGIGVVPAARPVAAAAPAPAPAPSPIAAPPPPPPKPVTGGRANTLMFGGDLKPPAAYPVASPQAAPAQPAAAAPASPFSRAPTPAAPPVVAAPPAAAPAPRPIAPSPQPPRVAPAPVAAPPPVAAAPAAAAPAAASGGMSRATTRINGHLTDKLGELGLSQEQVEAVLALSRDVVERVVWEVVPELAEMLIKEEISRLTQP